MNYRKNYLATTMASSSFLIDLVHVMSGEQLYRASFEHPELLCLPWCTNVGGARICAGYSLRVHGPDGGSTNVWGEVYDKK